MFQMVAHVYLRGDLVMRYSVGTEGYFSLTFPGLVLSCEDFPNPKKYRKKLRPLISD